LVGDPLPGEDHRYGLKQPTGFHTHEVFSAE
jgi:hypothetical protein